MLCFEFEEKLKTLRKKQKYYEKKIRKKVKYFFARFCKK